jgi:hypothetical protein
MRAPPSLTTPVGATCPPQPPKVMEAEEDAAVAAVERLLMRLDDDWRAGRRQPWVWLRRRVADWLESEC